MRRRIDSSLEWVHAESDWLRDLARARLQGMRIAPNWFTAVMGTGIVANGAMLLPLDPAPGWLRLLALGFWLLALLLLVTLGVLAALQRNGGTWGLAHPAIVPFWGAPPMALLTVSAGTLLAGPQLLGAHAAIELAGALWLLGTLAGAAVSVAVPRWLLRHPQRSLDTVSATWLLPVVPPLVSAATGAALVPHAPAGAARLALLLTCCALFVLSLLAVCATLVLLARRHSAHGLGPAHMRPTLFIVLGPCGQSITAACLLATAAPGVTGAGLARGLSAFALAWSAVLGPVALGYLALATALTLRTALAPGGLPFASTWWSFIFPLGTCVTGACEVTLRTGSTPLRWLAVALFALLVAVWLLVAAATARHARERARARRTRPERRAVLA